MRITEPRLKQLIKEELESPEVVLLLKKLLNTLEDLDISIDYLSAAFTGELASSVGSQQRGMGRLAQPRYKRPAEPVKELNDNDE
jgi:hypothetical protein